MFIYLPFKFYLNRDRVDLPRLDSEIHLRIDGIHVCPKRTHLSVTIIGGFSQIQHSLLRDLHLPE